jgi:hypothetical protein
MRNVALAAVLSCVGVVSSFGQDAAVARMNVRPADAGSDTVTFESPSRVPGPNFGTSAYEVVSLTSYAFTAGRETGAVTGVNENGNMYTWATAGSAPYFVANVAIPAGAVVDWIGLDYCDTNASAALTLTAFDSFGDNNFATIGSISPPDRVGCGYAYNATPYNYATTNNSGRILTLYVFQAGAVNGSVSFRGAEVWFKRRVSPGPGTATFSDVPTSSPYFKFVEALYAAGVVGGCGGSNYCPGNTVTRGQLAVFLASALGMHFPD